MFIYTHTYLHHNFNMDCVLQKQVPLLAILDSISSILCIVSSLLHWCVTLCAVHVVPLVVSSLQTIQEELSFAQTYVLSNKAELQKKVESNILIRKLIC